MSGDEQDFPVEIGDGRAAALKRDQYRCRRCGEQSVDRLTVHHVIYRSRGGDHDPENLVTLCWEPCHRLVHDGKVKVYRVNGTWFFKTEGHWRHKRRPHDPW